MIEVRRTVRSLAMTAGVAAGALAFVIPATASEATSYVNCPGGNVTCAFDGYNYVNSIGYRSPGTALADISLAHRNLLSGWINYTTTGARFYYNTGGLGTCVPMYAQNRATAQAGDGNPDNNQAESWAFTRTC